MTTFLTSPTSSLRTLATRTLPSCSTRTPLSLILRCLPSGKTPQAKVLGAWFYSSFEHCCTAPSLSGTPTVTFCYVHIHNVVAKKRDASTDLLLSWLQILAFQSSRPGMLPPRAGQTKMQNTVDASASQVRFPSFGESSSESMS